MSTIDATTATFDETIAGGAAIVDFWAEWCGPCRAFAPVFAESATQNPHVAHVKVDVDANSELAARFAIRSIPTLILFKNGQPVGRVSGALGSGQLAELVRGL